MDFGTVSEMGLTGKLSSVYGEVRNSKIKVEK